MCVLALLSGACSSLGLALGALLGGDLALSAGPALMVVYVLVGAVGPAGVNKGQGLQPLRALSPMRWACQALLANEFRGQHFPPDLTLTQPTGGEYTHKPT